MQVVMQEIVPSALDLVRKPSGPSSDKGSGKSFEDYLAALNPDREKYGRSPVEVSSPIPDRGNEKEAEPQEKSAEASPDIAGMVAPMLQGNIPQGGNTVNSLQLAGAGNGEAESLALHLSLSGTSVEGIGVEATGANAGAGADSSLTLLTEAQALFSEEMPLQTGVQEEAGLQNPKVLEGKGEAAATPTKEGQKALAFRFQGAPQAGETTGSSAENAVKAFQEAKPVQAVRPEGVSQGVLESTSAQSSLKQIDLTASTPTGSSGNEADLGLGQAGNTGQVGVNAVSAEAVPAQNQEAFIGRLAQVLQEQILAKSELFMRNGRAEIRLELKPEYLGRLFVRLSLENGALNVKFVVENQQVRSLIENNMTQLKQYLSEQGIDWQDASVDVGSSGNGLPYADRESFSESFMGHTRGGTEDRGEPELLPDIDERYRDSLVNVLA